MTWCWCGWSKLTWFLHASRKPLGFSVSIELDFVFVWVVELDLISMGGIELDLISVRGSELTWFCVRGENYFVLLSGSERTWFLCQHMRIALNLDWGSKLT